MPRGLGVFAHSGSSPVLLRRWLRLHVDVAQERKVADDKDDMSENCGKIFVRGCNGTLCRSRQFKEICWHVFALVQHVTLLMSA